MPFFSDIGQQVNQAVDAVVDTAASVASTVVPDGSSGTTAPPGGGAAGLLRIDPSQVDGAITVFRNALAAVEDEVRLAKTAIMAMPPANDAVSVDIANAFNRISVENANSAVAAWDGAVEQLRSIIAQLEAARETNVSTDVANSGFLTQQ